MLIAMKCWAAALFFLLTSLAFAGAGKINGTVVDESGVPVPHMVVEAFPLDMGSVGRLPRTISDDHGRFSIGVQITHSHGLAWRVYSHDEDEYYPDLSAIFYQTEDSHGEVVQLDEADPQGNIRLRLGRKAGRLKVTATGAATGTPLASVRYELAWADDAKKNFRMDTTGYPAPVNLLLPSNVDVRLTICSAGHRPWTYPGMINLNTREDEASRWIGKPNRLISHVVVPV